MVKLVSCSENFLKVFYRSRSIRKKILIIFGKCIQKFVSVNGDYDDFRGIFITSSPNTPKVFYRAWRVSSKNINVIGEYKGTFFKTWRIRQSA
jgi:hypothetical protein